MDDKYIYYIFEKKSEEELPLVLKLERRDLPFRLTIIEDEAEGPFNTKSQLRKKSVIYKKIKLEKNKQRVLKNCNIERIKHILMSNKPYSTEINFVDSFPHVVGGKISRKIFKGAHFYEPNNIEITKRIAIDKQTGVWSAIIKKKNEITGIWIKKKEPTTFFPESWSIGRMFFECDYAYKNKIKFSEKVYYSRTITGVKVKFIIDDKGKVITFYPEIENSSNY